MVDPDQTVDLASKAVVSALRLNDIITADVILNRNARRADALFGATPTLINVRKATAPVRVFSTGHVAPECANRSGRVVEYLGPEDGELTIVYNDGVIYHRNAANVTFTRERLSPTELSDLLHAFRDANFDAMPTTFPQKQSANRPSLALIAARYQRVALGDGDARLAPLLERIAALADRATSHAHYLLKSDPGAPIVVTPWAHVDVDLARLVNMRTRLSAAAPEAWRRPVPADLLASLPAERNQWGYGDRDPNRLVYFSQAGRLYRVARPFSCADARGCVFRELNAAEVAEWALTCEPGTTNCLTMVYPDGRREHTRSLTAASGLVLWPQSMGVKLRDVPPSGLTFSTDEYNRHKAIYSPSMKFRRSGLNYIEDGMLYAHVRVCLIQEGDDPATCEGDADSGTSSRRGNQDACGERAVWPSGMLTLRHTPDARANERSGLRAFLASVPFCGEESLVQLRLRDRDGRRTDCRAREPPYVSSAPFVLTAIGLAIVIVGVYVVSNVWKEPLFDARYAVAKRGTLIHCPANAPDCAAGRCRIPDGRGCLRLGVRPAVLRVRKRSVRPHVLPEPDRDRRR